MQGPLGKRLDDPFDLSAPARQVTKVTNRFTRADGGQSGHSQNDAIEWCGQNVVFTAQKIGIRRQWLPGFDRLVRSIVR
jgi:hypothetical protein